MSAPAPEFSRPFRLDSLGHEPVTRRLEAGAEERAALARRFDLLALDRLEAEVTLRWGAGGILHLQGHLSAQVVQRCVVTLEPVTQQVEEEIALRFSRFAEAEMAEEEAETGLDPEAPEPLPPEGLDLGEEVAQALSLGLDPYPRAPGATLDPAAGEAGQGPFAALAGLKPGPKRKG